MLWYKAWRESRTRFLLSAVTIAGLSAGFVVFHRAAAEISDKPLTYMEYIWRIAYKGYLRELYVILALLLGVGGLLRERDFGTAGFTLTLPISRLRIVSARAAVGMAQIAVLAFLPAMVIPALSPFFGQIYPWPQALQFGLLWAVGGAVIFMMGFLASSLFGGEYTAPVVALLGLLSYSMIADLPFFERYSLDIHDVMSGAGMSWFQPKGSVLIGPLPWAALAVFMLIAFGAFTLAGRITRSYDF